MKNVIEQVISPNFVIGLQNINANHYNPQAIIILRLL